MIALDHLGAFAPLFLQLERRLEEVHIEPGRRVEPGHHARRRDAVEPAISHQSSDDRAVLLLDEGLVVLLVGTRSRHLELLPATPGNDHLVHEPLSLSKSTPRNSQGNKLWARLIASTTRLPSRVTSGMHSVQPVATSTIVRVWMNEPATDVPPCATMSTSQKPGAGSFQSLNVRIGTSRRIAE